jgi:hypothetical protein
MHTCTKYFTVLNSSSSEKIVDENINFNNENFPIYGMYLITLACVHTFLTCHPYFTLQVLFNCFYTCYYSFFASLGNTIIIVS